MTLPRSKYVQEGKEGVYHCYSRCVRRANLYGFDVRTGRDFSHRKVWLINRLRQLAGIFAIEVCAYAIMENHYHIIVRTRPDIATGWTDDEVASRWLKLFPRRCGLRGEAEGTIEGQMRAMVQSKGRIETLRGRLSSLSWFMGRLNEYIARAANREDEVKGRFWESRYKCQALLDDAAIAACMVYVDLNPIRAGLAGTLEESNFTSIQERIRVWGAEKRVTVTGHTELDQSILKAGSLSEDRLEDEGGGEICKAESERAIGQSDGMSWLCSISWGAERRGILPMTEVEYFDLVDRSGRMVRLDKRGAIEADLEPILLRIGAKAEAWRETISHFGRRFHLVAGLISNIRNFADRLGRRWFTGVTAARAAFAPLPPQLV